MKKRERKSGRRDEGFSLLLFLERSIELKSVEIV